ncbi:hypothetical protein Trydic_g14931, partial [Trypoxylus dichotomus]
MVMKELLLLLNISLFAYCIAVKYHPQERHHNHRIVGGDLAGRGQAPYLVSVQSWLSEEGWQHICGGAIVCSNVILTAAHCVFGEQAQLMRVKAGVLYLNETGQTIDADSYILHPQFSTLDFANDIALLNLKSDFVYNKYVSPTRLPAVVTPVTSTALLAGWGSIDPYLDTAYDALQFVYVPIIDHEVCVRYMTYTAQTIVSKARVPIYNYHICAGPLTGGTSSCSGDSGGPLQQNNITIGVGSWTIRPCGTEN